MGHRQTVVNPPINQLNQIEENINISTNLVSLSAYPQIQVYPNPFSNQIRVQLNQDFPHNGLIRILNSQGQPITKKTIPFGVDHFELSTSAIGNGVFWIQLLTPKGWTTRKIIKIN